MREPSPPHDADVDGAVPDRLAGAGEHHGGVGEGAERGGRGHDAEAHESVEHRRAQAIAPSGKGPGLGDRCGEVVVRGGGRLTRRRVRRLFGHYGAAG
jgi:hypothetical protein